VGGVPRGPGELAWTAQLTYQSTHEKLARENPERAECELPWIRQEISHAVTDTVMTEVAG
jgi:hypothetical protein